MSSSRKTPPLDVVVLAHTAHALEIRAPRAGEGAGSHVEPWLRAAVNELNRAVTSSMRLVIVKDASTAALKVVDANAKPSGATSSHLTITAEAARAVSSKKLVVFMQYFLVTLGPLGGRARIRDWERLQSAWNATVGDEAEADAGAGADADSNSNSTLSSSDSLTLRVPEDVKHEATTSSIDASTMSKFSSPARRSRPATPSLLATPSRHMTPSSHALSTPPAMSRFNASPVKWPSLEKYLTQTQT